MTVTSIRLNLDLDAPLEKLARDLDQSKNHLIAGTGIRPGRQDIVGAGSSAMGRKPGDG